MEHNNWEQDREPPSPQGTLPDTSTKPLTRFKTPNHYSEPLLSNGSSPPYAPGTPTKQKTHSYLQPDGPLKHDRFKIPQIYPKNSVASVVESTQPTDIHAQSKLRQAFP